MISRASLGIPAMAFWTALSILAVMENWTLAFRISATTLWL
jgi:hypothetical protein